MKRYKPSRPPQLKPIQKLTNEDEAPTARKKSRKELALELREIVDTVGKAGKSGAMVKNVISVGMFTEGWDAKTVTHIMGLRAFSSQLLCEQVVGRGLRRTSYDVNEEQVYSSLNTSTSLAYRLPSCRMKTRACEPPKPTTPKFSVEAIPERRRT